MLKYLQGNIKVFYLMVTPSFQIKLPYEEHIRDVNLKDDAATSNLKMLFAREKGTLFWVNEQTRKLEKVEGWKNWIWYQWNKTAERAKVKDVIDKTLKQYDTFLSEHSQNNEAAVRYLFNKKGRRGIGRLRKSLFDQKLLKCGNQLSRYILKPNTLRVQLGNEGYVDLTNSNLEGTLPFPLNIELGNKVLNHNLRMLLKRKKGEIYKVNRERKFEKSHKKGIDERAVQQAVTDVIKGLNVFYQNQEMNKAHKIFIDSLFSETGSLCRMNRHVFNRGAIEEGSFLELYLTKDVQKKKIDFIEALKSLRDAKTDKAEEQCLEKLEKALINFCHAESEFAKRLGSDLESIKSAGSGGARKVFDRFAHPLFADKNDDEGPYGINNPYLLARIKRVLLGRPICLEGVFEPWAEWSSWLGNRIFKLNTVPPTDIRKIRSKQFKGGEEKVCSVQMWVDDCVSLGEYLGIPTFVQLLPRFVLGWYTKNLKDKLPKASLERAALHDGMIENLDGHFDNFLVKEFDPFKGTSVVDRVFAKDTTLTDKEIGDFVDHFFENKGHQEILNHLLFSEEIVINGKKKRIMLIQHDAGASHPHRHPGAWDHRSYRNARLIGVLPNFDDNFSEHAEDSLKNKKEDLEKFLIDSLARNLQLIVGNEVFSAFKKDYYSIFQAWVKTEELSEEIELRLAISTVLPDLQLEPIHDASFYEKHLKRIRGIIQTRRDCFKLLQNFVQKEKKMGDFFQNVLTQEDFDRELKKI